MPRTYKACLIGCGRMGATIDDEVAGRPDSFIWQPFSHAAAAVACERTDLVAVSDVFAEKAEAIRQRYGAERAYTDYQEMIEKGETRYCLYRHASRSTRRHDRLCVRKWGQGHLLRKTALLLYGRSRHHGRHCSKARGQIQLRHAAPLYADLSESA